MSPRLWLTVEHCFRYQGLGTSLGAENPHIPCSKHRAEKARCFILPLKEKRKGKLLKNQSPPGQPRLHTLVFVIVIVVKSNLLGFLSLLPFWRDATVLQLRAGG